MDDDNRIQLKRQFADFLEHEFVTPDNPQWTYGQDGLRELCSQGSSDLKLTKLINKRLMVSEHHLREFDPELLQKILQHPAESLPAFQDAVKECARNNGEIGKLIQEREELHVGLKGDFGRHEVSPRELTSERINQLVCVFGIVTKCSLVRPKVVKSVHYCEKTKLFTTREYRDVTSLAGLPTGAQYPTKDDNGNLLTTEYGLCVFKDSQVVTIQELPETAPPGQMPHSTEIILEDDLVDKVKPGDRVSILGMYKAVSGSRVSSFHGGVFKALIVGVSVQKLTRENTVKHTVAEVNKIRQIAGREDVLQLLANSLAPSIYGHDLVKRGLVLQLFGGLEKNLKNGTHLRGDINCLLVGDPGVAKSQMLRATMNVAPHAVSTTGRGCSGVGLTAAVTHDNETGEKRLEAGAMVLADRGVVCIDEFDKMSDQDRVAIHEVMEQQTVTIAKAGIHCSLNARCSVLAAANPLYGSYDKSISVMRNVNLPDSLLSRFDMLFVVLDQMNDARDRQVALHVIKQHRYRPPGEDGRGAPVLETIHDRALQDDILDGSAADIFLKQDARLQGSGAPTEVLTSDFLRKYIIFARRRYAKEGVHIDIEDEAAERIVDFYTKLRSMSHHERALPVTARTLETIIRIATASCKVCLRYKITAHDVEIATDILYHVMNKDVGAAEEDEEDMQILREENQNGMQDEQSDEEAERRRAKRREKAAERKRIRSASQPSSQHQGGDEEEEGAEDVVMEVPVSAEASVREARTTKRQRTARLALGFPEETPSAPAMTVVDEGGVLDAAQQALVSAAVADLLRTMIDFVPVSELEAACAEKGFQIPRNLLVEHLQMLQRTYSPASGMPQIMVDLETESFFEV